MKLHTLIKSTWRIEPQIQRGRGNGSQRWNYSGRWLKGQKARSGSNIPRWFEGGQTPMILKLPKLRGFKKQQITYSVVNLTRLESHEKIISGMTITPAVLMEYGLASSKMVKILGQWELTKVLHFQWIVSSKSALDTIVSTWWSFTS